MTASTTLLLAVLLAGCGELPPCPQAEAVVLQSIEGGMYIGFTPETAVQWQDAIRREARGECKYRRDES